MRISDWSSDVCSSDLRVESWCSPQPPQAGFRGITPQCERLLWASACECLQWGGKPTVRQRKPAQKPMLLCRLRNQAPARHREIRSGVQCVRRSEEHTSELQSLMRRSYAVFCWKKKKKDN